MSGSSGIIPVIHRRKVSTKTLVGFHDVATGMHALNAILLYFIARHFDGPAFLTALVFAVHPLASQGVAYISGRASVFACNFALASVLAMLNGWVILACVLMLVACLAKEDAAAMFAVLSLIGWLYGMDRWWWPIALPFGVAVWERKELEKLFGNNGDVGMQAAGFPPRMKTLEYQIVAFTEHVIRFPFLALGLYQSIDPEIPRFTWWRTLAAVVIAVGACGLVVSPFGWLVLGLILIPALPYIVIPMPDPVMEQRLYISVAGISLALGFVMAELPVVVTLLVVVCLAGACMYRAWNWSTPISVWASVVMGHGRKERANINLGTYYLEKLDYTTARYHCREALKINPNMAIARANMAHMDKMEGKLDDAEQKLEETVERSPNFHHGWYALGMVYQDKAGRSQDPAVRQSKLEQAYAAFVRSTTIQSWHPAWNRRGLVETIMGRLQDAEHSFRHAAAVPLIDYKWNLAIVLNAQGKQDEAIAMFKQLPQQVKITPDMLVPLEKQTA